MKPSIVSCVEAAGGTPLERALGLWGRNLVSHRLLLFISPSPPPPECPFSLPLIGVMGSSRSLAEPNNIVKYPNRGMEFFFYVRPDLTDRGVTVSDANIATSPNNFAIELKHSISKTERW